MVEFYIREIKESDNKKVEAIIRSCLVEFGANHEGTAWEDPYLDRFSEVYSKEGNCYWVAENIHGEIVGGVGIGSLPDSNEICELQKMYCLPVARGTKISHALIESALKYAKKYYKKVYLETLENMVAAQKFYEKYGFYRISKPDNLNTGHYSCNICYIKDLF